VVLEVLVEVVLVEHHHLLLHPLQQLLELLILVAAVEVLEVLLVQVVLASSLFNIQNKEVKSYGTLCTDWL
jgi:hypothetical protein